MDNGAKITQESKEFIDHVIREYIKMGPEKTIINIKSNMGRHNIARGNNVITVSVLNQEEANMLRTMQEAELEKAQEDPAAVWDRVLAPFYKEQRREEEKNFLDRLLDDFDEDKTRAEANKNKIEKVGFKERLKYKIEERKNDPKRVERRNKVKRILRNGYKKLEDKVYRLGDKTREKAEEMREFLSVKGNGIKMVSLICVIAFMITMAIHEIGEVKEGYEAFEEIYEEQVVEQFGQNVPNVEFVKNMQTIEIIQKEIEKNLTNEFRKALDNNNIELQLEIEQARPRDDKPKKLKITLVDPKDPDFNRTFEIIGSSVGSNPNYIEKIAEQYMEVNRSKSRLAIGEDGQLVMFIAKTKAGMALKTVKEKVENNDITINADGGISGVPERVTQPADNER